MNVEATSEDYSKLNRGSEHGYLSLGFTDFSTRATDLWFEGKESAGKSGIIPATFPTEEVSLSLEFWLIHSETRIRFQCWCMNRIARMTHVELFLQLYSGGEGTFDAKTDESEWDESELTITLNDKPPLPLERTAPLPTGPLAATGPIVVPPKAKSRKKKDRRSDMFDPFSGLLH